jgi:hypothetical protein
MQGPSDIPHTQVLVTDENCGIHFENYWKTKAIERISR